MRSWWTRTDIRVDTVRPGTRSTAVADHAALQSVGLSLEAPAVGLAVLSVLPLRDFTGFGQAQSAVAQRPRARSLVRGRELALDRLRQKCAEMGAVGVVGIRLAERPVAVPWPAPAETSDQLTAVEFTATGSPVTANTAARPPRPFRAALSGADVAALLANGWVPVDVLVAATIAVYDSRLASGDAAVVTGYGNAEVVSYTEVVKRAGNEVRKQIGARARALGADGVLLPEGLDREWTLTRHVVQAIAVGTAITRFSSRRRWAAPAAVLPLS